MGGTTEGPNNERRGNCMKRHGIASDNLPWQAAARPQDESVTGHGGPSASIPLEAMGKGGLSGIAQMRCVCARSMEHQQKRTRPVAPVENPGAIAGLASEVLPQFRSAIPRGMTGNCSLNRRVRSRMHGGVGGARSRGLPPSRLGISLDISPSLGTKLTV